MTNLEQLPLSLKGKFDGAITSAVLDGDIVVLATTRSLNNDEFMTVWKQTQQAANQDGNMNNWGVRQAPVQKPS